MGGYDKGRTVEFVTPCHVVVASTFCRNTILSAGLNAQSEQ